MLYVEEFDNRRAHPKTTVVVVSPLMADYDAMFDWCKAQDTGNRFASVLYVGRNELSGEVEFYFENSDDAILFRLRWAHAI